MDVLESQQVLAWWSGDRYGEVPAIRLESAELPVRGRASVFGGDGGALGGSAGDLKVEILNTDAHQEGIGAQERSGKDKYVLRGGFWTTIGKS